MALKLTPLEFEMEKVRCNSIFLNYSDYHLNAEIYGLMSEDQYLYDCMYLNVLEILLNKYWYDTDGLFYIGSIEVTQEDIIRVIDFIHHYNKTGFNLGAISFSGNAGSGSSGSGSYSWPDIFREFTAETDNTHSIVVNTGYTPAQVFLNGFLISVNDWTYAGSVFTYTGDVILQASDWFSVHFKKTS